MSNISGDQEKLSRETVKGDLRNMHLQQQHYIPQLYQNSKQLHLHKMSDCYLTDIVRKKTVYRETKQAPPVSHLSAAI